MRLGTRAAAASLAAAMSTAGLGLAAVPAASAATPSVIAVTMSSKSVTFAGGTSIVAGNVVFQVKAVGSENTLQLARLHAGYTKNQAKHDINAAFGGDKTAIQRVDTKIDWLGGVHATPKHSNVFAINLAAGSYLATVQDSNATLGFTVVAGQSNYRTLYPNAYVTTKGNEFHSHTSLALDNDGWIKFHNNAQEPHMLVLQHVKQSTTNKDVQDYIASGSQQAPSWGLPEESDAGVISPGRTQVFSYHLPAGKYIIMCFWPSIQTGKPHFAMGMYKLVELS